MMLKEGEILNYVTQHSHKWSTYNQIKLKKEMIEATNKISEIIRESKNKGGMQHVSH